MKKSTRPEVNIGMVGHVDHGKTTLTQALSGVWADTHSEEIKRGISIRLGYADTSFYKCPNCEVPKSYSTTQKCKHCGEKAEFLRSVSFVDAPGHETLMATMISGAAIMDGAILLIAADEKCPQPQTEEHLKALEIAGVKDIIVVQNKIDLVTGEQAVQNYNEIKEFLKGTIAENAPIIPVSAHHDVNIDVLIGAIQNHLKTPQRSDEGDPFMYIARSFDVNKPGTPVENLLGGIVGGSLLRGKIKSGDALEIRPGIKREEFGKETYKALTIKVTSLLSGKKKHKELTPGGLAGIGTNSDPSVMKSDNLKGMVIGTEKSLPPVVSKITLEVNLLKRIVGSKQNVTVEKIKTGLPLMLTIGTTNTVGVVTSERKNIADLALKMPVCASTDQRVAISRMVGNRWHLVGYGVIKETVSVE